MDRIISHFWTTFLFILPNCSHCGSYDGNFYLAYDRFYEHLSESHFENTLKNLWWILCIDGFSLWALLWGQYRLHDWLLDSESEHLVAVSPWRMVPGTSLVLWQWPPTRRLVLFGQPPHNHNYINWLMTLIVKVLQNRKETNVLTFVTFLL